MTPEQADALRAQMLTGHFAEMSAISAKATQQTQEWSAVGAKLADRFTAGEVTIQGLVDRERQEIADRLSRPTSADDRPVEGTLPS